MLPGKSSSAPLAGTEASVAGEDGPAHPHHYLRVTGEVWWLMAGQARSPQCQRDSNVRTSDSNVRTSVAR